MGIKTKTKPRALSAVDIAGQQRESQGDQFSTVGLVEPDDANPASPPTTIASMTQAMVEAMDDTLDAAVAPATPNTLRLNDVIATLTPTTLFRLAATLGETPESLADAAVRAGILHKDDRKRLPLTG